jgi:hypothetical protein
MSAWSNPIDFNASLNNGLAEGGYAGTAIPVAMGGTNQTTLQTVTAANKIMATDTNANLSVNNLLEGYTLTVSSTTAVQMTAASTHFQLINGTAAQPFWLPDVSTIPVGTTYIFIIQTSGNVTLLTLGGAALLLNPMFNGCKYYATSLLTSGTTSASWVWGMESSNSQYIPILGGGTGAGTKANAFNALSPMTTGGDLIYGGASGAGTRLANGTAGQVLTSAGTTLAPTWASVTGTGTVTSVAATVPTFLSVAGTPITGAGTLAFTLSGTALPVANGGTGLTANQTAATASTFASWDANANLVAKNHINGTSVITSAGGTTALTVASNYQQFVTGTLGQTITLPQTSTLIIGQSYYIDNNSTATIAVNTFTTGLLSLPSGIGAIITCLSVSSDATSAWNVNQQFSLSTVVPIANGGTGQTTASAAFNALSPMTTAGDLIYGGTSGAGTRLAAGSSGQILKSNGTSAPAWLTTLPIANGGTGQTTASAAFNALSPVTTTGDLIYGNGTNSNTRLNVGSAGQVLLSNGTPSWVTLVTSGSFTPQLNPTLALTFSNQTGTYFQHNPYSANVNFVTCNFAFKVTYYGGTGVTTGTTYINLPITSYSGNTQWCCVNIISSTNVVTTVYTTVPSSSNQLIIQGMPTGFTLTPNDIWYGSFTYQSV